MASFLYGILDTYNINSLIQQGVRLEMSDESDTSADTSYGVGFNVPTEDFTLLSIGVFVILLRVFARWKDVGPAKWQLDDYLMPLVE